MRYGTGETVIWVQGRGLERWDRPRRRVVRTRLAVSHVLASAALPLVFPAVRLAGGWHGDGGVRLTAPFSPAIHLGAGRILAVSTRQGAAGEPPAPAQLRRYPSPALIGGQLLDAVFLDVFDEDARRLARVNDLCRDHPGAAADGSRVIDTQLIRPSRDLCALAAAHERELPRVLRFAGRGLGTAERSGSDMLTLLMFVPGYVEELLALGERDADARAEDVAALLDGAPVL